MRVMVSGHAYSRSSGTCDRQKAIAALAAFVCATECAHPRPEPPAALETEWLRYEKAALAVAMPPQKLFTQRQAWHAFAVWLAAAHPEAASLHAITPRIAAEYMAFLGARRASVTCNRYLSALKSIFLALLGESSGASNPWEQIKPRHCDVRIRRELSAAEVGRLLAAAHAAGREEHLLFALAVYTGLRLGDCCRLGWENIDLERAIISLVPHKTRRHARCGQVVIPIHPRLAALLEATPPRARSGFLIPTIGEDYLKRRWRISKSLGRIFDKAGIERSVRYEGRERLTPFASFHSLRHSFVSFAANAGVPLAVVQAIVGHSSPTMTRHYYHADEAALRKAVNAIPSFDPSAPATAAPAAKPAPAAAPAAAPTPAAPLSEPTPSPALARRRTPPISVRLRRLERLFQTSLVTAQEYSQLRARVLAEA